jgi:GYF domain 2
MANYKVIGGDLKQYGPVSDEEVRKWIADGRLNAMSLAQVHGDTEWKPLSTFPEFAEAFTGKPGGLIPPLPTVPPEDGERQAALQWVKGPAIALKITAILNLLLAVWSLVRMTIFPPNLQQFNSELHQLNNPQFEQLFHQWIHMAYGPFGIANSIFGLVMSALIFIGATKMQSLRSYEFAMTAAILAMVPCLTPCCVIGLPFGIWAVVALNKAGVKSQFH